MAPKVEEVRGKRAVIRFEAGKCIHSRHCVLGRLDVFVPNVQGEWIHPDRATPEEIAELAHNCPSGYWVPLCRCWASKNKPYCDSSHKAIAFSAS